MQLNQRVLRLLCAAGSYRSHQAGTLCPVREAVFGLKPIRNQVVMHWLNTGQGQGVWDLTKAMGLRVDTVCDFVSCEIRKLK